jgi:hypothetical protein
VMMLLFPGSYFSRDAWGAETMINSKDVRIARIVERYVATHYQSFESLKYEMVVKEEADTLVVFYKLPDGVIGGTPTVVLRKGSLEVVRAYRTQ